MDLPLTMAALLGFSVMYSSPDYKKVDEVLGLNVEKDIQYVRVRAFSPSGQRLTLGYLRCGSKVIEYPFGIMNVDTGRFYHDENADGVDIRVLNEEEVPRMMSELVPECP